MQKSIFQIWKKLWKYNTICLPLQKKIYYHNKTVYNILTKEIPMSLPNFQKKAKQKKVERGIVTSVVTCIIWLLYEGICSYLHKRTEITSETFIISRRNKILDLENSVIMYGIYNAETVKM